VGFINTESEIVMPSDAMHIHDEQESALVQHLLTQLFVARRALLMLRDRMADGVHPNASLLSPAIDQLAEAILSRKLGLIRDAVENLHRVRREEWRVVSSVRNDEQDDYETHAYFLLVAAMANRVGALV
jgi:hypothetical protein